jgi:ribosomal protein S18 acetylase RimI-like enzyme
MGAVESVGMSVREARPADRPAIRDVARRSLQASYSLGPQAITVAIEEWYDESRLERMLEDEDKILLVVERDDQVVAFSDSIITGDGIGTLLWLHVDPDYRGDGLGDALFEATSERLEALGAPHIQGRVLADNTSGNTFYERHGLEKVGEDEVEIDGRPYVENIYGESEMVGMESIMLDDGTTVYIDHASSDTGSVGVFNPVYNDDDGEERYGYYCANCEQLANSMDSMGRIECDNCGNVRKPTRWDAAYL